MLRTLSHEIDNQAPLHYIDINQLTTPKKLPDKGVPFWEQQWINPELKALLFSANQPTTAKQDQVRTYLIVDATSYIKHRGVFDLDLIDDCPVICMFKGEAAQSMKMAAPYLIDITLDEAAYNEDTRISHFHRRYFETMWGNDVGIFIQSSAPMKIIHQHFRKFLKFEVENDNNRFFRYWDPRVLKVHLPALAAYFKTSHKFFALPNEQFPAVTFIYEDHTDQQSKLILEENPEEVQKITTKIASFNQGSYDQMEQQIVMYGPSINKVTEPPLPDIVTQAFILHKTQQFCEEAAAWLVENYGEKQFEGMSISEFLFRQIDPIKKLYHLKSEFAMYYALAGCYLLACNIEAIPSEMRSILDNKTLAPEKRSTLFLQGVQDSQQLDKQIMKD